MSNATGIREQTKRQLEVYVESLDSEIRALQEQRADAQKLLGGLSDAPAVSASPAPLFSGATSGAVLDAVKEYSGLGMQAAAERFLKEHPDRAYRANAVMEGVKSRGFTSDAKHPNSLVVSALARLVVKGIIEKDKTRNGTAIFRWKKLDPAGTGPSS